MNRSYRVRNDSFHEKGFEILMNEFKNNKERIPLFDCVYMALIEDLDIKEIALFDEHFDNKKGIIRIH